MEMARVKYDLDIYPLEIINIALLDYKDYADIGLIVESNTAIVSFSNCKYGDNLTAKEFGNYLIDLIGSKNGN